MALTATYDSQLSRVRLAATGLPAGALMRVERSTDQIRWSTVRGGVALNPAGGEVRLDDYEFADAVVNHYRVVGPTVWDGFDRVATNGFGPAPTGQPWTHLGTSAAFFTDGSRAYHQHTAANSGRISEIELGTTDPTVRASFAVPAASSGAALIAFVMGRRLDDNNYYMARIGWPTDGLITCTLRKRVAGVENNLTSVVVPGLTHFPGALYAVKLSVAGASLAAKVWRASEPEPAGWTTQASDISLTSGTKGGVRTILDTGSTNSLPFNYAIDDFGLLSPEGVLAQASITPTLGGVWLKSLDRPFLSRQVLVSDISEVTRPARAGIHQVVGRSLPVAVSDVRGGRQWTMAVLARTDAERRGLELLVASGDTLLVHVPAGSRVPGGYVQVADTGQQLYALDAVSTMVLPLTEVAAPGPDVVGAPVTWQSVLNRYATWGELLAAHPTWASVMELVGDPEDVIVP